MKSEWSQQRERSNRIGIAVLVWIALHLGRWPVQLLLYPVVLYFYATGADVRAASRNYLRRVNGCEPRRRQVFRHLLTFARVASDRLFLLSGGVDKYQIKVSGEQVFHDKLAAGQGCLLLVSHLGSFEAMRVLGAVGHSLPLRILLDRRQNPLVGDVIDSLDPQLAAGIIDAGQPPQELALTIDHCLKQGHMVGIMADRAGRGESVMRADFLGCSAAFPTGPWQLALVLKVPVILCFGLYLGDNRYQINFELMTEGVAATRQQRQASIAACIEHYATRLEHYTRLAPYNWFNFYDFWAHDSATDS
jgi:predicted LPLAT superfamily acyltransferase